MGLGVVACCAIGLCLTLHGCGEGGDSSLTPSPGAGSHTPTAQPILGPTPFKACYWYNGFDARGVNNTSWDGPGANDCTSGPSSDKPCTKEDCCKQCQSDMRSPLTGERCAFVIWNPSAAKCFFKTAGAVAFAKAGDVTCCPEGQIGCPSAPPGGPWALVSDFSDEFPVNAAGTAMMPLNVTKWNTSVASWSNWTWASENVKIIAQLPGDAEQPGASSQLLEIANSSGYAAITMTFEKHQRDGKTLFYKSGIMKSTFPAGILYGRFEARIKGASRWPGVCPAFWAWRHTDKYWTELDFVEMQQDPSNKQEIDFTSHVFAPTPDVRKSLSNLTRKGFDFDPRDDFHLYAMEWNSTLLTWWVDNRIVNQLPSAPYFKREYPMDIALSLGLRPPLSLVPNATGFPTTFYVDWVRTWQKSKSDSLSVTI